VANWEELALCEDYQAKGFNINLSYIPVGYHGKIIFSL